MFKNLKWYDISIVKLSVLFFTLMLVQWFPDLLTVDWKIYGILFLIFAGIAAYRFWFKK